MPTTANDDQERANGEAGETNEDEVIRSLLFGFADDDDTLNVYSECLFCVRGCLRKEACMMMITNYRGGGGLWS